MMHAAKYFKSARKQQGLAMVEMAIAVPVLLVFLLLITELSRALYQYNTLTKSVRDGSRFLSSSNLSGSQQPTINTDAIVAAKNLVVSGLPQGGDALLNGMTAGDVEVEINEAGSGGMSRYYVTVSAQYRYVPLIGTMGGLGFIPSSTSLDFTLRALSSMRSQ